VFYALEETPEGTSADQTNRELLTRAFVYSRVRTFNPDGGVAKTQAESA
jgi:hypothetical protein